MSWKNQLITSEAEALAFLDTYLPWFGVPPHCYRPEKSWRDVVAINVDPKTPRDRHDYIFFLSIENTGGGVACFRTLGIHDDYRKKGLSNLAMKAALGIAYAMDANIIKLMNVMYNGPSFASSSGAVPEEEPHLLYRWITDFAEKPVASFNPGIGVQAGPVPLNEEEKQLLFSLARIAEKNPYAGWRALGTSGLPEIVKLSIFQKMRDSTQHDPANRHRIGLSLLLIPGEPGTNKILTDRLGVIPPFRPPQTAACNAVIAALNND